MEVSQGSALLPKRAGVGVAAVPHFDCYGRVRILILELQKGRQGTLEVLILFVKLRVLGQDD